jgi:O-antigen/teichoic acid export membrane protein
LFVFLFLLFVIISPFYKIFEGFKNYFLVIFMMGVYLILLTQQTIFLTYANRVKKYKVISAAYVISAVSNLIVSVILGLCGFGTMGYFIGTISSCFCFVLFLNFFVNPYEGPTKISDLFNALRFYKKLPITLIPTVICAALLNEIPLQFLGRTYSLSALGQYGMANKFFTMIISLLAPSIGTVYFKYASDKLNNKENLAEFMYKIVNSGIKLAIVPFSIMIIFGESILKFILGPQWGEVGDYMSFLGFYYLIFFCGSCITSTLTILNKSQVNMIISFIMLVLLLIICTVLPFFDLDLKTSIFVLFSVSILKEIILLFLSFYYAGVNMKKFYKLMFLYLLIPFVLINILKIFIIF